jgi:hypothetical protein
MATLGVQGRELVLRLSRAEKLGALHGDVRVALRSVEDLRISRRPFGDLHGTRAPGTGIPRLIALGTWRFRGGKDFAALYRGKEAVIVDMRGAEFQRLLVATDDPDEVLASIAGARADAGVTRS